MFVVRLAKGNLRRNDASYLQTKTRTLQPTYLSAKKKMILENIEEQHNLWRKWLYLEGSCFYHRV